MNRVSTKEARTEYPRLPGYTRVGRDSIYLLSMINSSVYPSTVAEAMPFLCSRKEQKHVYFGIASLSVCYFSLLPYGTPKASSIYIPGTV